VNKQYRARVIKRLMAVQTGLTLCVVFVFMLTSGNKAAFSSLLGGLICVIPNIIFAALVFKHQGAQAARKIVRSFYKGEALKIVTSVLMFAVVFVMFDINAFALFITYIIVQMSNWFAPLVVMTK